MIDERKVMAAIELGIAKGLVDVQLVTSKVVRSMLSQPGTGRIYRIAKGKKNGRNLRAKGLHRASAPGRPPAVNTNRLRASWAVSARATGSTIEGDKGTEDSILRTRVAPGRLGFEYGSNVPYARFLEYGTRRMRKRPYITPVMAKVSPRIAEIVAKGIRSQLRASR